jgi:GDPmannose 4,6-dehydratase
LQDDHEVIAMARNIEKCPDIVNIVGDNIRKIKFVYGNLSDIDSLSDIFDNDTFDGVFHLGAFAHPPSSFITPLLASQTNIIGTGHMCDKIIQRMPNCVFMNCSTPEVYGICPGDRKITEDFPMRPNNPYGVSKAGADMYMIERTQTTALKGFLTRAFSHTGPRRGSNFSISSDAIQIARILRFDNKIQDGEIFHIAGNDLHEIQYYLDIMLEISKLTGKVKLEIEPKFLRKVEIPVQIPDDSKVRKLLDWEPKIPIEQTLEDLLEYWLTELESEEIKKRGQL